MMRRTFFVIALFLLSSCGFRPLDAGGTQSRAAATLRSAQFAPIGLGTAIYQLHAEFDDNIGSVGRRRDQAATQDRRALRARSQLDLRTGIMVLDATARSDQSIDIVSFEYAMVAAKQSVLEQLPGIVADPIAARLALDPMRPAT